MRTIVNTNRQVFANNLTAARTHLRCLPGVNSCDRPTSFLRFVERVLHQSPPGDIGDALVHPTVIAVLHILNIQVLKGYELKPVDQLSADLVGKVPSTVRDTFVDMLHHALALAMLGRAFLMRVQALLRPDQRAFILAEEARVGNVFAGAQSGKVYQSNVNTCHLVGHRQRPGFDLAREASIPVAEGVAAYGECLDLALDGPVHLDLEVANLGEPEPLVFKKAKVAPLLRVREAIVSVPTLEAGIARLLVSSFDPAEESTECQVDPLLGLLLGLRVTTCQPRVSLTPVGEQLVRVVLAEALLLVLPGIAPHLKCLVVHPSARVQDVLQLGTLALGWIQPVLECPSHKEIVSHLVF